MTCECWSTDDRCQPCRDSLYAQLRGVAACRGERWADELAMRRRAPWTPWPRDSERVQRATCELVADLSRDVKLRWMLVEVAATAAARRWNGYGSIAGGCMSP